MFYEPSNPPSSQHVDSLATYFDGNQDLGFHTVEYSVQPDSSIVGGALSTPLYGEPELFRQSNPDYSNPQDVSFGELFLDDKHWLMNQRDTLSPPQASNSTSVTDPTPYFLSNTTQYPSFSGQGDIMEFIKASSSTSSTALPQTTLSSTTHQQILCDPETSNTVFEKERMLQILASTEWKTPRKNPLFQSGRAVICRFPNCNLPNGLVLKQDQRSHNLDFHGVEE